MTQQVIGARDFDTYSDTVLYDVFYEAGTQLGAVFVELTRHAIDDGDDAARQKWQNQHQALNAQRAKIRATDRAGQVAAIRAWDAEKSDLLQLLPTA